MNIENESSPCNKCEDSLTCTEPCKDYVVWLDVVKLFGSDYDYD